MIQEKRSTYSDPVVVGRAGKDTTHQRRTAHHPAKPYNLCVLVRPRNENADSPSKNWVSGITPLADSRLNHPLPGIVNFDQALNSENRVRGRRLGDGWQ